MLPSSNYEISVKIETSLPLYNRHTYCNDGVRINLVYTPSEYREFTLLECSERIVLVGYEDIERRDIYFRWDALTCSMKTSLLTNLYHYYPLCLIGGADLFIRTEMFYINIERMTYSHASHHNHILTLNNLPRKRGYVPSVNTIMGIFEAVCPGISKQIKIAWTRHCFDSVNTFTGTEIIGIYAGSTVPIMGILKRLNRSLLLDVSGGWYARTKAARDLLKDYGDAIVKKKVEHPNLPTYPITIEWCNCNHKEKTIVQNWTMEPDEMS